MKVPQYLYATNEELQRFLSLLVQQMQSDLSDNGWQVPVLSQEQIDMITSSVFLPVMRRGTLWFNTDEMPNGKLQFITEQAIPHGMPGGPLTATYETITSV